MTILRDKIKVGRVGAVNPHTEVQVAEPWYADCGTCPIAYGFNTFKRYEDAVDWVDRHLFKCHPEAHSARWVKYWERRAKTAWAP